MIMVCLITMQVFLLEREYDKIFAAGSSIQKGAMDALKTQRSRTYIRQGAINKPQFQWLSFTASMITFATVKPPP